MESKFSYLSQRDYSVSMLRLKMSRRRSQTQKENREKTLNARRQLEKLIELDVSSVDASVVAANMSVVHQKTLNEAALAKKTAVEERVKQLERWKERKAMQKEKEKREKERRAVFKTGLYHPKDSLVVFPGPAASSRGKEIKEHTAPSHNARVTRSMKQQLQLQTNPLKMQGPNTMAMKAQPVQRPTRTHAAPARSASSQAKAKTAGPSSTRSANGGCRKPVASEKPKEPAVTRTTRSRAIVQAVAPYSVTQKENNEAANTVPPAVATKSEEKAGPPSPLPTSEPDPSVTDQPQADSVPAGAPETPSFAPKDFVFQAPAGLTLFKFEPLTPQSADAFLTPSLSFSLPPAPGLDFDRQDVPGTPPQPKTPQFSPPVEAPLPLACATEPQHNVPYFRAEVAGETGRLTSLCVHWEAKIEDESIPEEMRDRMRTAVGQARLLMKERFKQFTGLVDDCEFARGEKITTCTDLQGFWDMVYYQVEDVNKKFTALKDAESRAWVEEIKPPPPPPKRQVKKPSDAPAKPAGSKAAAKSRLAAVKAAMRARQQAAGNTDSHAEEPQGAAQPSESVVFDGGFFQVESPVKPPGSQRRSSRLGSVWPQASPCCPSPRRVTRRSRPLVPVPASPSLLPHAPSRPCRTPEPAPKSLCATPGSSQKQHPGKASLPASACSVVAETLAAVSVAEAADVPPSTRESLPPVSPGAEPTHPQLSFTLTPCASPSPAPASPQPPAEVANTSAVEEISGLDFERYLQPSQRCSVSPMQMGAMEMLSPVADVEMASPDVQTEDRLFQQKTALPAVSSFPILHSPQTQTVDSALLLFTPNPKDRIRPSVCPSDLMVFTPPF